MVVADGEPLHAALVDAVADGVDLVVTTGGTGHTPMDLTPEMTLRVVERLSPGLAEAVRAHGVANGVPTAILSRGIAGIAGTTLIVNLPGSSGGARDGDRRAVTGAAARDRPGARRRPPAYAPGVTRYIDVHPDNPQPRAIAQVADILRADGLIAYPTDSGYALGCLSGRARELERIREIRGWTTATTSRSSATT